MILAPHRYIRRYDTTTSFTDHPVGAPAPNSESRAASCSPSPSSPQSSTVRHPVNGRDEPVWESGQLQAGFPNRPLTGWPGTALILKLRWRRTKEAGSALRLLSSHPVGFLGFQNHGWPCFSLPNGPGFRCQTALVLIAKLKTG